MPTKVHFNQSDVRRGAVLYATYQKGVRLNRSGDVIRPLYVQWVNFRNQFVHEHSLETEAAYYLETHPEIARSISVPK